MKIISKIFYWITLYFLSKKFGKKDLGTFISMIENSEWEEVVDESKKKYVCKDDRTFEIEIEENTRNFSESWTQKFLHKDGSWSCNVNLKISGRAITTPLIFIYVDGHRLFVPLPERHVPFGEPYLFWSKKSLRYKVSKIVGFYDYFGNLEKVANHCNINIVE